MMKPNLKDILIKDAKGAKAPKGFPDPLAPGEYNAKIIGFTEEDTYNYLTVNIDSTNRNYFYDYYIYGTTDLNLNVINWFKALATIPITENTNLLDIANSAIGSTYIISIYNYTGKRGKNKGKVMEAIDFKELPVINTQIIETEEIEDSLPF